MAGFALAEAKFLAKIPFGWKFLLFRDFQPVSHLARCKSQEKRNSGLALKNEGF
jgi:hypothetical protein